MLVAIGMIISPLDVFTPVAWIWLPWPFTESRAFPRTAFEQNRNQIVDHTDHHEQQHNPCSWNANRCGEHGQPWQNAPNIVSFVLRYACSGLLQRHHADAEKRRRKRHHNEADQQHQPHPNAALATDENGFSEHSHFDLALPPIPPGHLPSLVSLVPLVTLVPLVSTPSTPGTSTPTSPAPECNRSSTRSCPHRRHRPTTATKHALATTAR